MSDPEIPKDDELLSNEDFTITIRKEEVLHYDITLNENVNMAYKYEKIFTTLRDLPYNTAAVNLYLANFGGYIQGLVPLYNAIKSSSVPVDVHVTSNCYSCGALLALAGRSLKMYPNTMLMFHNYSGFEIGKGKEMHDAIKASEKNIYKAFTYMAHPFLTKEEVLDITNDNDVYVHWDDKNLKHRIERHFNSKRKSKK